MDSKRWKFTKDQALTRSADTNVLPFDETNKDYVIDELIKLDNNKILIMLHFNGRAFNITVGPEDFRGPNTSQSQSFQQRYLDALNHSFGDDEPDDVTESSEQQDNSDMASSLISNECCYEEDPLITFIMDPFLTHETFTTFASKSTTPRLNTLQDVLHPPLLSFGLHGVDEKLVPINQSSTQETETRDPPWADIWESKHWLNYPRLKPEEIKLSQTSQTWPDINLIMFNNEICWFKPVRSGVSELPYIREIDMLFNLSQEDFSPGLLRFPQLKAIVLDREHGHKGIINGLILSAIYPNHGTLADRVDDLNEQPLTTTLRKRWYNDIKNMIQILHEKHFIWGDVSPNNVLIDENENIWIIDFGGGYTEGWVELEDKETQKGDLEGLKKMKSYLLDMD